MAYIRKLPSLVDMATYQLAINLCQDNSFKEIAMCLEKPSTDFAMWSYSSSLNNIQTVEEFNVAINDQCQRLTEGLPHSLKIGVHVWITRIALEYLSYCRRMDYLFNVPCYILMDILTRQHWTETGRINEKRLAKRLLKDDKLTVLLRYRIACTYCLRESIPHLWNRLTSEEKQLISGNDNPCHSQEQNHFVLLWSYFMDGRREEKVTQRKNHLWTYAAQQAVHYGNQTALLQCWKRLNEHTRKQIVMRRALQSLEKWMEIRIEDGWIENLVLPNEYCRPIEYFNLPSYYSELMRFFLSKMTKEEQLTFFEKAIRNCSVNFNCGDPSYCILDSFSEWPLNNDFLPTMERLWGILPKAMYGQFLLSLAGKYNQANDSTCFSALFHKKENLYYDYRSMLWYLWEEAPQEHKQYLFYKEVEHWGNYGKPVIEYLLPELAARSPLQEKDVALFKRVFQDVPQENRKAVMYAKGSGNICFTLIQKEMWSFINWLLEECLPKEDIPIFKRKFSDASIMRKICFIKLRENCEKYVEGFIDWALESVTDKLQFRYEMIKKHGVYHCSYLLSEWKYTELERIINFCLSSEDMKLQFKTDVIKKTCNIFLNDCAWEQMDRSVAWAFDSEEKISKFKHDFYHSDGSPFYSHLELVFNPSPQWENVERFYKWFCLSPEEIIKLKRETVFTYKVIDVVCKVLCGTMDTDFETTFGKSDAVVKSLRWCLTDEETIMSLKEKIEKNFLELKRTRYNKNVGKEKLECLVNELLQSFQQVVHDKTGSEGHFLKRKRGETFLMMENESSPKRKQF